MKWKFTITAIIIVIIIFFTIFFQTIKTPSDYPLNTIYNIKEGTGLNVLTTDLVNNNIIKSPYIFKVVAVLYGGTRGIMAGDYNLNRLENVITLAKRFSTGNFGLVPVKITIPEGYNVYEISKLVSENFPKVSTTTFVSLAQKDEGYLFPDTYLFLPNASPVEIVNALIGNYHKKIQALDDDLSKFNKTESDIIKMASIIEEEARTEETRRTVAGILWKRLDLGMPLQVDSSFKYINGKTTATLTMADLKINSPYNSYLYKGLPPTPICNPGLDSIRATITPIKTDYLFFLTDKNGNMYYAKTYSEHLKNKELFM
jgi:UPF0755 protein